MTVKDLKEILENINENQVVIISKKPEDAIDNDCSPVSHVGVGKLYFLENKEDNSLSGMKFALVLYPMA